MTVHSAKIWFYLDRMEVGGPERIVLNLLSALSEAGWSPVLVLNEAQGALLGSVPEGVPVRSLGTPKFVAATRALARLIRDERPDLIISQRSCLNAIAVLALLLSRHRAKLVLAEHTLLSEWLKNDRMPKRLIDHLIYRSSPLLYRAADAVVGISQGVLYELENLLRLPSRRLKLLYNPIIPENVGSLSDAPLDLPWEPDNKPVILGVGRLSPEKGFDMLLDAFAHVLSQRPSRLVLVGSGPERAALEAKAEALGVADVVHLVGYQENVYPWLRRAKVLALSSVLESFPTVLVEAMAVGTPVVAFDCPKGPGEIITHEENGLLIPPRDPAALAEGILRIFGDPELAVQLCEGGARRAADFTFNRTLGAYVSLFQSLLQKPA